MLILKNTSFLHNSKFNSSRTIFRKLFVSAIIVFSAISMMGARGCGNSGGNFPTEQAIALQASLDQSKLDFRFPGGALAIREVGGATWMGDGYYPNGSIITISQLLNMTAGVTSYTGTGTFYARYVADPTQEFLPEELVSCARDSATPNGFAPGAGWNYSNTNFVILGLIAEKAGGSSFKELITTKIIEPLGLNDTSVPTGDDRTVPREYVSGYKDDSGTWLDSTLFSPTIAFSAGNMISTLPNMLKWIESIHEMKLLTEYSTNQMMEFVSMTTGGPLNGGTAGYGLGLAYHKGAVGHSGEINGYKVIVNKYKNHYFAVILNTDFAAGNVDEVFWRAVRVLYPNDNV